MTIVALDQGTTSTRAIRFGADGAILAQASRELLQMHPEPGWVEQDPERIWQDTLGVLGEVVNGEVVALGIANQRETVVIWERSSGKPIYNAIVWQDRRTADDCARMQAQGHEHLVRERTGLILDPYFSATKAKWILDHVPGARKRAEAGELAFGTIETFIIWRLTEGRVHVSDVTNASRTLLFDITRLRWDEELLALFDIPAVLLPTVVGNAGIVGHTAADLFGRAIAISGVAGDQQAAMVGQGCFEPGSAKATYGTGCFLLANVGDDARFRSPRLLTTVGYQIGAERSYALEGAIFAAGSAVKWLRDGLGILDDVALSGEIAADVPDDHGVYFVPAFGGLGAPHWLARAQATITGFDLGTSRSHLIRAALEAAAYQTDDLLEAIAEVGDFAPAILRVDGGMMANDWLAQFLADLTGVRVERSNSPEATAIGAASLAGLGIGLWKDKASLPWRDGPRASFVADGRRQVGKMRSGWRRSLEMVRIDALRTEPDSAGAPEAVEPPC